MLRKMIMAALAVAAVGLSAPQAAQARGGFGHGGGWGHGGWGHGGHWHGGGFWPGVAIGAGIAGAGYYHAPFHAFYPRPYNFYDAGTHQYFYGGSWNAAPHRSVINVSAPTPEASVIAEQGRALIQRNGFGSTSHSYFRGS